MLKKYTHILIVSLMLFCLNINLVFAYEPYQYVDSKNEKLVMDRVREIYAAKEQYEDLIGGYELIEVIDATSKAYWWPIGSSETTIVGGKVFAALDPEVMTITSEYGLREDPLGRTSTSFHSGIDISGGRGEGNVNIIAAKDGVVVYPSNNDVTDCPSSRSVSSCGGGYGNYVIIQHSDGNYTLYAHMYANSITVVAGESVKQGQVIGKMGSSGNSTGAHLHFEVRIGANTNKSTVNPLNYVSTENPRLISSGGEILTWLNSWEGHTTIDGDYYIVQDIGDGVRSVGSGITLENTSGLFAKRGINVANYPVGSRMQISLVDEVELEVISGKRSYIENILSQNSITLEETQIDSLISRAYNTGNINGFVDAYKKYGNTDQLYENWFLKGTMKGTKFEVGLTRRRNAEWTLFHTGEYVYNG